MKENRPTDSKKSRRERFPYGHLETPRKALVVSDVRAHQPSLTVITWGPDLDAGYSNVLGLMTDTRKHEAESKSPFSPQITCINF